MESCILSLSSLQNLTQLCLTGIYASVRSAVLTLIGKACPALTHLSVTGASMNKGDILVFMLGKFFEESVRDTKGESYWFADENLGHLIVPPEYLSPICPSLREFRPIRTDDADSHNRDCNWIYDPEAAFFLRHFPLLEVVDKRFPASLAVTILHDRSITKELRSREIFQQVCQDVFEQSGNHSVPFHPPPDLSDSFSRNFILLFTFGLLQ